MIKIDEVALEDAAKAEMKSEYPEWKWEDCEPYHWIYRKRATNSLKSYLARLEADGLARNGWLDEYSLDHDHFSASDDSDKKYHPCTIIRERQQP